MRTDYPKKGRRMTTVFLLSAIYLSLSVPIRKNRLILIPLSDKKKPPMKWKKPVNGFFSGGGEQEKLVTALLELKITIATIRKQVNHLSRTGSDQGKWILMADHTQFEQFLNKAHKRRFVKVPFLKPKRELYDFHPQRHLLAT